jgi:hypothetical protein
MKRQWMRSRLNSLPLVLGLVAGACKAAMISPPNAGVPVQTEDWGSTINVSQFDPSQGTLNSVYIETLATDQINRFPLADSKSSETFPLGAGFDVGTTPPNLSTLVGETFHIEYEYSPVPETSTCGVIAGLGCLIALARRLRA